MILVGNTFYDQIAFEGGKVFGVVSILGNGQFNYVYTYPNGTQEIIRMKFHNIRKGFVWDYMDLISENVYELGTVNESYKIREIN